YTRGSSGDDQASGVAVDASGNVFLGGLTKSTIVGTNAAGHDAVVGRLDASGAETWLIQYGNGSNVTAGRLRLTPSGDPVLVGTGDDLDGLGGATTKGHFVARFAAADGATTWTTMKRKASGVT